MRTTVVNVRNIPRSWRDDPAYVYCGRPGRGFLSAPYGNPHVAGWCQRCQARHDRAEAVAVFDREACARHRVDPAYRTHVERLRGKKLVCFCAPLPCHCDTYVALLEYGAGEEAVTQVRAAPPVSSGSPPSQLVLSPTENVASVAGTEVATVRGG